MAKKAKQDLESEDDSAKKKPVAKSHGRSLISQIFGKGKKADKSAAPVPDEFNENEDPNDKNFYPDSIGTGSDDDSMGSASSKAVSLGSSGIQSDISGSSKSSQKGSAMLNGSAMNQTGSAMNQKGSALNQNGSAMNQSGSAMNQNGSALYQTGSALNNNGSAMNQNGSAMNQSGSAANKGGFSAIKTGKAGSGMSKSSYSSTKPGIRQTQSESALLRNVSGSGSGMNQKTGSAANPLNEEDEMENEINELMSDQDMVRSDSPTLPARNQDFQVDEEGRTVQVVPCTICGRKFAVDRIQTHANICSHQKERKPYDVAMMRVAGTEAEEMVRNGKIKLDPAKPIPKKSVLHQQVTTLGGIGLDPTKPLPPILPKNRMKGSTAMASDDRDENGKPTSYQLVFDENDEFRARKTSKYNGFPQNMGANNRLPTKKIDNRIATKKIDERFLSAEGSKKGITSSPSGTDYMVDSEDDDDDYLAASMTSQRTVCSDAFDFLFDSQNLNPDKIEEKLKRQDSTWSANGINLKPKGKSSVCVIS